jgi:hypothetical protein
LGVTCLQVDVEDFDDIKSGFRVKFTFTDGNPFFANRWELHSVNIGSMIDVFDLSHQI